MFCDYFYGSQSESFSFFRIPRELIKGERYKELSTDAKLLYGLLLDRMSLSAKNGWYDDQGRVYIYYTRDEIMEDLNCSHSKATKIFAELDSETGIGLVERMLQGQGKPAKIYVKQFVEMSQNNYEACRRQKNSPQDDRKSAVQTAKNLTSGQPKNGPQDVKKTDPNYINKNYTDNSYTYSSILPEDMTEEVKEQIDYEMLCHYYPYDDPECMLQLICEVLCSTAPYIKIEGVNMPASKVQSRFRKLSFKHVAYVLDAFRENTNKINNIKAYFLTALYNAPLTIGPYYSNAVRHDSAKDTAERGKAKDENDKYSEFLSSDILGMI